MSTSSSPPPEEPGVPTPLSPEERAELDRLKVTVALTERSFILSGLALHKIHERELCREFPSWDAFCRTEFDRDGSWGYLQMKAALAVAGLSQYRDKGPCPRHRDQALLLAQIRDSETRQRVWDRAIEIAAGRRVTSAIIQQAIEELWVGRPGERIDPDAGPSAGARPQYDPGWAQTENVKRSGGRVEVKGRHRHDLGKEIEREEPEPLEGPDHDPDALHAALDELRPSPGGLTEPSAGENAGDPSILPDEDLDELSGVKQGQVDAEEAETVEALPPGDVGDVPLEGVGPSDEECAFASPSLLPIWTRQRASTGSVNVRPVSGAPSAKSGQPSWPPTCSGMKGSYGWCSRRRPQTGIRRRSDSGATRLLETSNGIWMCPSACTWRSG